MGDGFKIGDVVMYIGFKQGRSLYDEERTAVNRLRKGAFYRVTRIGQDGHGNTGIDVGVPNGDLCNIFADIWPPYWFRKLDAPRTEIADRIRACQPSRSSVPA